MKNLILSLLFIVSFSVQSADIPNVTKGGKITIEMMNALIDKVNTGLEVMVINMVGTPDGAEGYTASGTNIPVHSAEGDLFGSIDTGADTFTLPAGKYFFDLPALTYNASTTYATLYNVTDSVEVKRAYAHPYAASHSMTRATIKVVLEINKTTTFTMRHTTGSVYAYQISIMRIK